MTLFRILYHISKPLLLLSVVTGLIAGALSSGMIALIHWQLKSESIQNMGSTLGIFIVLILSYAFFSVLTDSLLIRLTQRALYTLRLRLSQQILSLPLRKLEELGSHRFLVVLTEDLTTINGTLVQLPSILIQSAIIVGGTSYMLWLSWKLALSSALVTILLFLLTRILVVMAKSNLQNARSEWNNLFSQFNDLTQGTKELLLNHTKKYTFLNHHLKGCCERLMQENITARTLLQAYARLSDCAGYLSLGLVIFLLPNFMTISKDLMLGYALTGLFLLAPFTKVLRFTSQLSRSNVSLKHIEAMGLSITLDATEALAAGPAQLPLAPVNQLSLENLNYHYKSNDSDSFNVGPVSFTAQSSQVIFVIGGNGSGKSTLAKLISGLYQADSGKIHWNGQEVSSHELDAFRQNFSVVFSDFYLFNYLCESETDLLEEKAQTYLSKFQLDKKVKLIDGQFSSISLSQGQRKRLALLNVYLEDRPVYIFDEWAADQDPAFKRIFYHNILPDLKNRGKIVFVITHDDAYFHLADYTLKMQDGQMLSFEEQAEEELMELRVPQDTP